MLRKRNIKYHYLVNLNDICMCDLFHQRGPVTPIQFSMNDRIIDVVQYINYLGLMLDADMSWKTHAAMVRNKLSRINGIFNIALIEIYLSTKTF